jgi:hypothetical protein
MITQERLKELLHYDPETGVFTWKVNKGPTARAGTEAGSVKHQQRNYYRHIRADGVTYCAHRLAWLYVHGKFPENEIDHDDGNGLHNWIKNLRDVTRRDNQKNRRLNCNNTSGTTGVSFNQATAKWQARIQTDSGQKHLGQFVEIKDAIAARKAAEIDHGYHENHGQIRPL